jgi:hypothetical protein
MSRIQEPMPGIANGSPVEGKAACLRTLFLWSLPVELLLLVGHFDLKRSPPHG